MKPVHYHEGRFPPEDILDWKKLIPLIGPAYGAVARYDGMLAALPSAGALLAPLTTREAVLSSRIEGIHATMGEVLEFEAGKRTASRGTLRRRIQEILNCRAAVGKAEEMLVDLPLCGRVIRAAHEILLSGTAGRGQGARGVQAHPQLDRTARQQHRERKIRANRPGASRRSLEQVGAVPTRRHPGPARSGGGHPRRVRSAAPVSGWQWPLGSHADTPVPVAARPSSSGRCSHISEYLEARRDAYYDGLLAVSRDGGLDRLVPVLPASRAGSSRRESSQDPSRSGPLQRAEGPCRGSYAGPFTPSGLRTGCSGSRSFSSAAFVRGAGIPRPSAHRILNELKRHGHSSTGPPRQGKSAWHFLVPRALGNRGGDRRALKAFRRMERPSGLNRFQRHSSPDPFLPTGCRRPEARGLKTRRALAPCPRRGSLSAGKPRLWPSAA